MTSIIPTTLNQINLSNWKLYPDHILTFYPFINPQETLEGLSEKEHLLFCLRNNFGSLFTFIVITKKISKMLLSYSLRPKEDFDISFQIPTSWDLLFQERKYRELNTQLLDTLDAKIKDYLESPDASKLETAVIVNETTKIFFRMELRNLQYMHKDACLSEFAVASNEKKFQIYTHINTSRGLRSFYHDVSKILVDTEQE